MSCCIYFFFFERKGGNGFLAGMGFSEFSLPILVPLGSPPAGDPPPIGSHRESPVPDGIGRGHSDRRRDGLADESFVSARDPARARARPRTCRRGGPRSVLGTRRLGVAAEESPAAARPRCCVRVRRPARPADRAGRQAPARVRTSCRAPASASRS